MNLNRQARVQLIVFTVIALIALAVMGGRYMKLPAKVFGVGRYTVMMELPRTGGLYETGNVTYRGSQVGRVQAVRLTDSGVIAELSLTSGPRCTASRRSASSTSNSCRAARPRRRCGTAM